MAVIEKCDRILPSNQSVILSVGPRLKLSLSIRCRSGVKAVSCWILGVEFEFDIRQWLPVDMNRAADWHDRLLILWNTSASGTPDDEQACHCGHADESWGAAESFFHFHHDCIISCRGTLSVLHLLSEHEWGEQFIG